MIKDWHEYKFWIVIQMNLITGKVFRRGRSVWVDGWVAAGDLGRQQQGKLRDQKDVSNHKEFIRIKLISIIIQLTIKAIKLMDPLVQSVPFWFWLGLVSPRAH